MWVASLGTIGSEVGGRHPDISRTCIHAHTHIHARAHTHTRTHAPSLHMERARGSGLEGRGEGVTHCRLGVEPEVDRLTTLAQHPALGPLLQHKAMEQLPLPTSSRRTRSPSGWRTSPWSGRAPHSRRSPYCDQCCGVRCPSGSAIHQLPLPVAVDAAQGAGCGRGGHPDLLFAVELPGFLLLSSRAPTAAEVQKSRKAVDVAEFFAAPSAEASFPGKKILAKP